MSTNTGRAPARTTALAVVTNVKLGRMTSSPGPTPAARRAASSADVQEVVARTRLAPSRASSARSRSPPLGPLPPVCPDCRHSAAACASRASNQGRCSASGSVRIGRPPCSARVWRAMNIRRSVSAGQGAGRRPSAGPRVGRRRRRWPSRGSAPRRPALPSPYIRCRRRRRSSPCGGGLRAMAPRRCR